MTTRHSVALVAALALLCAACGGDDETVPGAGAPPLQEGWPVPGLASRAQYRLTLELDHPIDLPPGKLYAARRLAWMSVRVAPAADGGGLELVRTQGKVGGTVDLELRREPRGVKPFPGDPQLSTLLFGEGGLPGAVVTRAIGADGDPGEGGSAAWTLLGVLPPPDAEVAPGLMWAADAALPLCPAQVKLARFEVEAVGAETIRVRATWPGADLVPGWTMPESSLVVDVSRRDGLAASASLEVTVASVEAVGGTGGSVSFGVRGTLERLPWIDAPVAPADVDAALADLAAADPAVRVRAADRLGGLGVQAGRGATVLAAALEDEDARVREAASTALRGLAERGMPVVLAFLGDENDADRMGYEQAIDIVCRLGARVTGRDLAAAGTESPPAGAVGAISVLPVGPASGPSSDGVWMLEGLAGAPSVLGPDGYETRDRDLGAACAALLALAALPPDAKRAAPSGVLDLLASPRVGSRLAGVGVLDAWGGAAPEVVEALRKRLDDEEAFVVRAAQATLARLGHPVGSEPTPDPVALADALARIDLEELRYGGEEGTRILDALADLGPAASPAVEALEALARKTRVRAPGLHTLVLVTLTRIDGPTRERREGLVERLREQLESGTFDPRLARPLLDALAVGAGSMDDDQARTIAALLLDWQGGQAWLAEAGPRRLLLALPPAASFEARSRLLLRLATLPPTTQTMIDALDSGEGGRPVLPGTERMRAVVRLGHRVAAMLDLRRDLIDAAGRPGSDDPRGRAALERLVAEGDAWTRTMAARALRRLDAR